MWQSGISDETNWMSWGGVGGQVRLACPFSTDFHAQAFQLLLSNYPDAVTGRHVLQLGPKLCVSG